MSRTGRVFLGLGSNLLDRDAHLDAARAALAAHERFTPLRASAIYETDPVEYGDQPAFLNQVVAGLWTGTPGELLAACQQIETAEGRTRPFPNAPRTLDIDILFWEGLTIDTPALTIPHPCLTQRAFALVPLLELAPDLIDPATAKPLSSSLNITLLDQGIRRLEPETARG